MTCVALFRLPLRLILLCALLGAGSPAYGGIAQYSDHGQIDFDTAMQLLNPYGTWAKVDGLWAYTPLDHQAPYTHGQWIYTDFGWYWKGRRPSSWATEHYGYWKRGADHLWAWYPGPYWLPEIVELRATPTHIGWRSAAVDGDGNFIEAPDERYARTDEWTFVTRAQFAGPITPAILAPPAQAAELLDDATDCLHTYVTYRPIERPGPHPADFLALSRNGGMFAPEIYHESADPVFRDMMTKVSTAPSPARAKPAPAPSTIPDPDGGPPIDARQVPYWTIMSLPGYWTPRPADAKPNEIYIYQPDFYQDQDGIERRIGLWLNPSARLSEGARLRDIFSTATPAKGAPATATSGSPAVPVGRQSGAFRSPFDDPSPAPSTAPTHAPASSRQPAPSGRENPAPAGTATPGAP